jgi:hypothetical protein
MPIRIRQIRIGINSYSVADPHYFELLDPDLHSNCGSGSRRAKMTHENRKKYRIFMFSSCKFFSILGPQTLDPDPESGFAIRKNAGSVSDPHYINADPQP